MFWIMTLIGAGAGVVIMLVSRAPCAAGSETRK